jgi:hypothetical protein
MIAIQKDVRDIIRNISKKYNISYNDAHDIIWSQFKFVRDNIGKGTKGDYDSFIHIFLRHFGTFAPSERKIHHMSERFNNKEYEK